MTATPNKPSWPALANELIAARRAARAERQAHGQVTAATQAHIRAISTRAAAALAAHTQPNASRSN